MDIRRYRQRDSMLTLDKLQRVFDGRYTGVIKDVVEIELRNPFKGHTKRVEPVIEFEDGERSGLNASMMDTLSALFGDETDGWRGKRITIAAVPMTRLDKKTGLRVRLVNRKTGEEMWERVVMGPDTARRSEPVHATNLEPEDDDATAFPFGSNVN